jgi:DNA end-binding protein Ku
MILAARRWRGSTSNLSGKNSPVSGYIFARAMDTVSARWSSDCEWCEMGGRGNSGMASTTWKGMMTFGLVSIPIRLYAAARSKRTYLHQLHNKCHTRLKQPLFCPTCNRIVDRSEVIKGYEYETGQYVMVEGEEIKKITPPSGRNMEILAFVPDGQIDPIYFDSSYLALPEKEGQKGYQLLLKALEDTHMLGIAKVTMHQREYTVFIRARDHGLTLHTMYYANEIQSVAGYGENEDVKLKPAEVKLAEQLVQDLAEDFRPQQYHDEFQKRLRELVEAKAKGQRVTVAPEHHRGRVIDIMQALKKSIAERESQKGQRREPVPISGRHLRRKAG